MAQYRDRNLALAGPRMDELAELLLEREALLEKSPELRAFQQELDDMMAYCCDPSLRLEILCMLLEDKLSELLEAIAAARQAARKLD
ncbi:MAG: hypothetical protein BWY87_01455 [Deltaproteobacteria bacterium ADurb.Bin510]|nr:MAG: hypothetical protein BWY87_01455 [Deltaproteobacteria bacterium ADurb.Bin510]